MRGPGRTPQDHIRTWHNFQFLQVRLQLLKLLGENSPLTHVMRSAHNRGQTMYIVGPLNRVTLIAMRSVETHNLLTECNKHFSNIVFHLVLTGITGRGA